MGLFLIFDSLIRDRGRLTRRREPINMIAIDRMKSGGGIEYEKKDDDDDDLDVRLLGVLRTLVCEYIRVLLVQIVSMI